MIQRETSNVLVYTVPNVVSVRNLSTMNFDKIWLAGLMGKAVADLGNVNIFKKALCHLIGRPQY